MNTIIKPITLTNEMFFNIGSGTLFMYGVISRVGAQTKTGDNYVWDAGFDFYPVQETFMYGDESIEPTSHNALLVVNSGLRDMAIIAEKYEVRDFYAVRCEEGNLILEQYHHTDKEYKCDQWEEWEVSHSEMLQKKSGNELFRVVRQAGTTSVTSIFTLPNLARVMYPAIYQKGAEGCMQNNCDYLKRSMTRLIMKFHQGEQYRAEDAQIMLGDFIVRAGNLFLLQAGEIASSFDDAYLSFVINRNISLNFGWSENIQLPRNKRDCFIKEGEERSQVLVLALRSGDNQSSTVRWAQSHPGSLDKRRQMFQHNWYFWCENKGESDYTLMVKKDYADNLSLIIQTILGWLDEINRKEIYADMQKSAGRFWAHTLDLFKDDKNADSPDEDEQTDASKEDGAK